MTYKISYDPNPYPRDLQILEKGIKEYAKQKKGHEPIEFFTFFIRNENNKIQGGCEGGSVYGCLAVDQLWVSDSLRGKGYGTQLMLAAEQWGKEKKCLFATVNTMDWEALGFYEKLGYYIEFERHGFLKDSIFYFLRKEFIF